MYSIIQVTGVQSSDPAVFIYWLIYLSVFVTVLGLSLIMVSGGYSLVAVHRLLIMVTFLLQNTGSRMQAQ